MLVGLMARSMMGKGCGTGGMIEVYFRCIGCVVVALRDTWYVVINGYIHVCMSIGHSR